MDNWPANFCIFNPFQSVNVRNNNTDNPYEASNGGIKASEGYTHFSNTRSQAPSGAFMSDDPKKDVMSKGMSMLLLLEW